VQTPRLAIFNLILLDFGDFAMERRMRKGIKAKAERVKSKPSAATADASRRPST
jgi:hypothetical protein